MHTADNNYAQLLYYINKFALILLTLFNCFTAL